MSLRLRSCVCAWAEPILLLILVPVAAHLLFSWIGFNPTDDGFILAHSRRLLSGQVPHRDFINIRPVLSPLLHTPFVLWGGERTFWWSRAFVWFEFGCIAWCTTVAMQQMLGWRARPWRKAWIGLAAFTVSVHTFPIMAWNTIDGLFLIILGLAIRLVGTRRWQALLGYLLIGAAVLCKQSFVLVAPLILLLPLLVKVWGQWAGSSDKAIEPLPLADDWRHPGHWLAIVGPGLAYLLYLTAHGALPAAIAQLTTASDLFRASVRSYFGAPIVAGAAAGLSGIWLRSGRSRRAKVGIALLTVLPLASAGLALAANRYLFPWSFALFGGVGGAVLYALIRRPHGWGRCVLAGLVALLLSWSGSLSMGYNFPILGAGVMLAWALGWACLQVDAAAPSALLRVLIAAASIILLAGYVYARTNLVYREQPTSQLTEPLDQLLTGASGIRSNENTAAFLADLREAIRQAESAGGELAILPDLAAYWVQAERPNPLPVDWALDTELLDETLRNRAIAALEAQRGHLVVIVQKVEATRLAEGFFPLLDEYTLVRHVRERWTPVGETRFFALYR